MTKVWQIHSLAFLLRIMACAGIIFLSPRPVRAIVPESHRPIGILLNHWTSQVVMAKITGAIFESMGYEVRYHRMTADNQWGGLHRGRHHLQVEIWEGTMKKMFQRMVETGGMVDADSHQFILRASSLGEKYYYSQPKYAGSGEKQLKVLSTIILE